MASCPLLHHGHKPEERRRGEAVVEHLQDHAVERGSLASQRCLVPYRYRNRQREDAQQTVAEVIHRRVGKDALQILLRRRRPRAHHYRGHGQHQQRGPELRNLRPKERNRNPQQAIDAHLRHGAGQQHGHRRRRLGIGRGQPGVEGKHRHLDGKAGQYADSQPQHHGAQVRGNHRLQFARRSQQRQVRKVHAAGGKKDRQKGHQQRHGAGHGIDKELRRRRPAPLAAPQLDEEESRNQAEFPE